MDYVWYASYGSNLSRERFMCYIQGGKPPGSTRDEIGCTDKTPPKDDRPIKIRHSLYFSESAEHWQNKGVGFINRDEDANEENATFGRMYLITAEQFIEVVRQENRDININIDLKVAKREKSYSFKEVWYGNLIYLDDMEGIPVFSFTTYKEKGDFRAPSAEYLRVITSGLKETYNFSKEQIADYLMKKDGIKGNFSREELIGLQQHQTEKS